MTPKVSSFTKTPEKPSNNEQNEDDDKSEKDDYDYNDDDYHDDDDDDDEIKNFAGETKGDTAKHEDSITNDVDKTSQSDDNATNDNDVKSKGWSNEVKAVSSERTLQLFAS